MNDQHSGIGGAGIIGVGIDHCQISRMSGILNRYAKQLNRRYLAAEVAYCNRTAHRRVARYAMHFAAKEATAKALGTGFREGISLSTIEVVHLPSGQPSIILHGAARQHLARLTPPDRTAMIALSLTDEADMASAICIVSIK